MSVKAAPATGMSDLIIVKVKSNLNSPSIKAFMKKCTHLIERRAKRRIILDFSEVESVSLLGQIALSSINNQLRALGGGLKVIGLSRALLDQFEETNLTQAIGVYMDEESALNSFDEPSFFESSDSINGSTFYIKELNSFVGWDSYPQVGLIQ